MSSNLRCEVLVEGAWLPGSLQLWYREPRDGRWKGVVQYTTAPGYTFVQSRDEAELRAPAEL